MPPFFKQSKIISYIVYTAQRTYTIIRLVSELENCYIAMALSPALSIVMHVPCITYPEVRTALS
jgi:hypothetical protein